MTVTATERLERMHVETNVLQFARVCVLSGVLDPTVPDAGQWANAHMQVAQIIRPGRRVVDVEFLDVIGEAFGPLCEAIADEAALDADRDSYLDRLSLPRTSAVADTIRGRLLADRCHWLTKLVELTQ